MNTVKTLFCAALLSALSLVSVAKTTDVPKPTATAHAASAGAKKPGSKTQHHSAHSKAKPKLKPVAHATKKPVTKKSKLAHSTLGKKKPVKHKKKTPVKHAISAKK